MLYAVVPIRQDMVLQFITMYPRTTARGMELEYRPSKIAKHYMMTWFCLDAWPKLEKLRDISSSKPLTED